MLKKWIARFFFKPNSREIYWGKVIPSFLVVAGFITVVYFNNTRLQRLRDERNRFKRYIVGVTTAEHNNIKGDLVVDYNYSFAGRQYSNLGSTKKWIWGKPNTHGGRYYVQLAYTNPSNAEIFFDYPVPDSIKNCPDSGWAYLPGYEKSEAK